MDNYEEREINLVAMLFNACKKWRGVVIGAIVIAVLVGAYMAISSISVLSNPETFEKVKNDYEVEKIAYEAEGKQLELAMEQTGRNLELQQQYNDESILMKIDANNEWTGTANFYIDTDYQILPGMSVQNENPAYKILYAYYDYAVSGEFYTELMSKLSFEISDSRYLKEIIDIIPDGSRYSMQLRVTADSEKNCSEILGAASSLISAYKPTVAAQLGDHTLYLQSAHPSSQMNVGRENYQLQQIAYESELEVKNSELGMDYKEWKEKEKELKEPVLDVKHAVTRTIKWTILGGIIGVFLGLAYLCFKYIVSAIFENGEELPGYMHELGELPVVSEKKLNAIDKLVYAIFGIRMNKSEYASRLSAVSTHVAQLWTALATENKDVAVVSDIDAAELDKLVADMNKELEGKCNLVCAGNILTSGEASKKAELASSVIFVVKQGETVKKALESMLDQLDAYDKDILGAVITNVDAK